jgi:3-oxoacyl-[acyl-carrier-protein] synthase-3
LPSACAAFDISLGCSGYVYGLSVAKAFMESNGLRRGLFFTADPYSKVIDHSDKDTALLFGDAATVTVLDDTPTWEIGRFRFGTDGTASQAIHVGDDRILRMNGRAVFEFSATKVPPMIEDVVADNGLTLDDIDLFLLHQGSRYIVSTIRKRLKIDEARAPFQAEETGNSVSSTLPLLLADVDGEVSNVVLAGFGVGLSWAGTVLTRGG